MRKKKILIDTIFDLDPVQKMYKQAASGRQYLHPNTHQFQLDIATMMKKQYEGKKLKKTAYIYNYIRFYMRKPKTSKRTYPNIKPDIDNLEKSFYDGITQSGVFWEDDCTTIGHDVMCLYDTSGYIVFRSWEII